MRLNRARYVGSASAVLAIASLLALLLPARFSTSALVTGKQLSASGMMVSLPGLYSIEIGVSDSFSSHLIYLLLKFGYENMWLSGSWSFNALVR